MNISGYIFAGGKSSRMGEDKATLLFAGKTLAERSVDRMRLVASRVTICGDRPELSALAPVLSDPITEAGPLAALVTALEDAAKRGMDTLAVVLAVDLPLLPWETLHWLVQRAKVSGAAATIPLVAERPQPTCAVYRSALAPALRKQLLAGERKLMRAVEVACTKPNQFDLFDFAAVLPERRRNLLPIWFTNVNTAEDLARAEAVHAAEVHAAKLRSVEARAQQADADRRVW